jgi:Flp pilus assembly protein TadD
VVPRLEQARTVELVSNAPPGLLWLAEKGANHERILVAEYEPKGGGKAFLRGFNLWFRGLKALPAGLLPALDARYIHEERLFLVFDAPAGQSARKVIETGRTAMTGREFLQHLLTLTQQFAQATGSSHGWIRAETVTVSDGKLLLGPPAFAPGEVADPQSDLKECARLSAQWAGIPLRPLDADAEQCNKLRKAEDWTLAGTIEWILFCKDRAPQSAGQAIEFLREAQVVPKGDSEKDLSTALDTLKRLYQRSGSTIVKLRIEQSEERLSKIRKASQSQPEEKAVPATPPTPGPGPEPKAPPQPTPEVPSQPKSAPKLEPTPAPATTPTSAPEPVSPVPPPPPPTPPRKKSGARWKVALAVGAILGIFGIYYYVANAPVREFNDYFDKQMIVNSNGPSAYSVYQKTMREKGPESSAIKSMNGKALPVLQKISKDAFDSWYKDSELSKPPERRAPGELALTTWAEMAQIQEWLSSIEKSPLSNARLAYARGMAALNRRSWDEARQQFEEALRSQPNWSLALNGLGKAYFGERRYDMTEKYYRQASEADPSWYFPHSNLGTLYRDILKNFEAAEREYRAAIQLDPNRASFHYNLGLLYYMHGKQYWPSACSELRAALSASGSTLTPSEVNLAGQRRSKACQGQ